MNRKLRTVLIFLALIIGGGLVWITIQDVFGDTKSIIHNSSVILSVTPNYKTDPPEWIVDSVFKGETDPQFNLPPGTKLSGAPGHFSVSGKRPDSLIVCYAPRFLNGPLQAQNIAAVYSGKIPAFGITQEEFIDLCSTK